MHLSRTSYTQSKRPHPLPKTLPVEGLDGLALSASTRSGVSDAPMTAVPPREREETQSSSPVENIYSRRGP
jgi:hypothetical protein